MNVGWDEIADDVVSEFGEDIRNMVNTSNSIGELMDKFADSNMEESFYEFAMTNGWLDIDFEDDE